MKPIFCIDVTLDKDNECSNGDEFLRKSISKEDAQRFTDSFASVTDAFKKAKLPLAFRILEWVLCFYALIVVMVIVRTIDTLSLAEMYSKAKFFMFSGVVSAILWLVIFLVGRTKEKIVFQDEHMDEMLEKIQEHEDELYASMGVPKDALSVDILTFSYKVKDGEIHPVSGIIDTASYFNADMRIYVENGSLCLADLEEVHAFPLDQLTAIHTMSKRISVDSWNKDESITSEAYKPYKLSEDKYGAVHFKTYHILEIAHEGETFGIYFPCYELPAFERLTGLKAETEED